MTRVDPWNPRPGPLAGSTLGPGLITMLLTSKMFFLRVFILFYYAKNYKKTLWTTSINFIMSDISYEKKNILKKLVHMFFCLKNKDIIASFQSTMQWVLGHNESLTHFSFFFFFDVMSQQNIRPHDNWCHAIVLKFVTSC